MKRLFLFPAVAFVLLIVGGWDFPVGAQEPNIEKLIQQLQSENSAGRELAAAKLKELKDPSAVAALVNLLRDHCEEIGPTVTSIMTAIGSLAAEPMLAFVQDSQNDTCGLSVAATVLGELKETRAVLPLSQLLQRLDDDMENNDVRQAAAKALGQLKDARATDSLLATLKSQESDVELAAVLALEQLQDPRSLQPLIEAFQNKESTARPAIAGALGHLKDKRATTVLVEALPEENVNVRKAAAEALDEIGWVPQTIDEKVAYYIAKQDWKSCVALGQPAVDPLLRLAQRREGVSLEVAAALGALKDPRAVAPLTALLKDPDFYTRPIKVEIATALAMLGSPAISSLVDALQDKDEDVRQAAAQALRQIKDPRVTEALLVALKDPDSTVRELAAIAMDKIGWLPRSDQEKGLYLVAKKDWSKCIELGRAAVEPLAAVLQDGDINVCRESARALGLIKDKSAVEPLIKVLLDTNSSNRESMAEALGMLKDAQGVEPLLSVFREGDPFLQIEAATALGEIGDARVIEPMIAALQDKDFSVRSKVAEVLDKLGWVPKTDQEKASYFIAKQEWTKCAGLGASAVEPLLKMLTEGDLPLGAASALGLLKEPRAIAPLIDLLKRKEGADTYQNPVEMALVALGPPAVGPLLDILQDSDPVVRRTVAQILGEVPDQRAVAPLVGALRDYDNSVRSAAAMALEKLKWIPQTETEKISYSIAQKNWDKCRELGQPAKTALLAMLQDKNFDIADEIIRALGGMADKDVIPVLLPYMQNWELGPVAANSLEELGWRPTSEQDKVHYFITRRDKNSLLSMWDKTQKVLLADVESLEYPVIENALFAFIGIGESEIIADLIEVISKRGTKVMAEAFLNCGNKELGEAAESWAASHGYYITSGDGANPVSWGSL